MTNGCGACDIHGAGCGAQAGAVEGVMMACRVIVGSGVKLAGSPIPLLKGANEAPIGLTSGWVESETGGANCALEEVALSDALAEKVVAAVMGADFGSSNCLN